MRILLNDYARLYGVNPVTIRRGIRLGKFKTLQPNPYTLDSDEPYSINGSKHRPQVDSEWARIQNKYAGIDLNDYMLYSECRKKLNVDDKKIRLFLAQNNLEPVQLDGMQFVAKETCDVMARITSAEWDALSVRPKPQDLLTAHEFAEKIQRTRATVYKYLKHGIIPAAQNDPILIHVSEIDKMLKRQELAISYTQSDKARVKPRKGGRPGNGSTVTDLTGQQFGRWKVKEFSGIDPITHGATFLCECECGTVAVVKGNSLLNGRSRSCGCLTRDCAKTKGDGVSRQKDHSYHAQRIVCGTRYELGTYTTQEEAIRAVSDFDAYLSPYKKREDLIVAADRYVNSVCPVQQKKRKYLLGVTFVGTPKCKDCALRIAADSAPDSPGVCVALDNRPQCVLDGRRGDCPLKSI